MYQFAILLGILHALQVESTIREVFDDAQKVQEKYFELVEVISEIINQNTNESNSNYVATIGVNNKNFIIDKVLMKISTTVSSPSEIHGLAKNTIIFAKNISEISVEENLSQTHRRGRIVICSTIWYSNDTEFFEQFRKAASDLWANRFSRMIFIAMIGNELNIFGIQPYNEKTCFPTELVKIATAKNGKIIRTKPFYQRIKNLNQCPLRITTTSGIPYAEIYVENNVTMVKGIEGKILNVLSSRMNFSTLIIDTEKLQNFDSRFNDSKDLVRSNESDLCFAGKKINVNKIEPTVSIMDCQKVWVVPKAELIPPWMQVIIPFKKSVWKILAFAIFLIGLMCVFLDDETASLMNMWSLFLGVSIELRKLKPARELVKILLCFWIFFSYVITRSYLAFLEGYLTRPTFSPEINTLEDLVSSGIRIEGHSIVEKLFCHDVESETSRYICNRFETRSIGAIFQEIKTKGRVQSAFTMKAEIYRNSKFLRDYETHVMQEALLKYPTAFLAQKGAPFLDEMNIIITRLIEAGFIDLWQRDKIILQERKIHYPQDLRVEHVAGIMFIAILGYAISIIIFCCEYFVGHFDFGKLKNTLQLLK